MYRRGCLLVSPALIAQPEIFDALCDAFTIIRHLEASENEHILIVEHEAFLEAKEGDYMPFYDPIFETINGLIQLKEIGAPYIHSKYFIQCQNQTEIKQQEKDDSPLIWLPEL